MVTNIILLYVLILIISILIFIFYFTIFFSNKNSNEKNFRIIHYVPEEYNYLNLISNLNHQFGIVDIYNLIGLRYNKNSKKKKTQELLNNEYTKNFHELIFKTEEFKSKIKNEELKEFIKEYNKRYHNFLLFGNYSRTINELPNITSKEEFLGGYNSCVSPQGDMVFLYKYAKGIDNKKIIWENKTADYLSKRTIENTFLTEKYFSPENGNETNGSYVILTRYLYNDKPALHVNYIMRKQGAHRDYLLQVFIGFLNYLKNFIKQNQIHYYSVAGRTNLNSLKWQVAIKKIFNSDVYYSPGVEKKFISDVSNPSLYYTPDFIFVCKNLAPYGVYFYLTEPLYNYTPNKILVCEILTKENKNKNIKSINDHTQLIYDNVINEKQFINKNLKIDDLGHNEINFQHLDFTKVNNYIPLDRKIKTLHFYDF